MLVVPPSHAHVAVVPYKTHLLQLFTKKHLASTRQIIIIRPSSLRSEANIENTILVLSITQDLRSTHIGVICLRPAKPDARPASRSPLMVRVKCIYLCMPAPCQDARASTGGRGGAAAAAAAQRRPVRDASRAARRAPAAVAPVGGSSHFGPSAMRAVRPLLHCAWGQVRAVWRQRAPRR